MNRIKSCMLGLTLLICASIGTPLPWAIAEERCENWVAKVVSVQGSVQARRAGEAEWVSVNLNDTYCAGDMIRVLERSRSAVLLPNETLLRLDEKTTVTFNGVEKKTTSLLDLLEGAVYFFSRIPRALNLTTPFVNGTVEGTEFFVRVMDDYTFLSIFEGRVAATNAVGSLVLQRGQSAIAQEGKAPEPQTVVRPRDAVRWALYYPPVIAYRTDDFPGEDKTGWQSRVRRSVQLYWAGDLAGAFSSFEGAPENIQDPRFFIHRAGLLISVGRVDEAGLDIKSAFRLDPDNPHAIALQSIIAVTQNKKEEALELARKSVALAPDSSTARVALSYSQQARFDLDGALTSLQEAVQLDSENPLAWARLAELWLSSGYLDEALEAAQKATSLNPNLTRTQTVLGFAYLTQIKTEDSKRAFEKAIQMDQAAPLPRLGFGLAKIREGALESGRAEIEIAASLDPNNSIIRSYLGKAYFEEKRSNLDESQYAIAKELDPLDPTPWFYDAIRKQTMNRPVEALQDLQKSIELNDNRAVYRSRLLLDEDLAARSASLGRIYSDLGFQQLALVEGWKSVNSDPSNHSAHRFLADSYSALPWHEIARVSEVLQSQLLQHTNITPVQPSLAETDLLILEGAGPADPAFNEFNPLFHRNRLALQASGIVGGNDTLGGEVVQSGVWGRASYSIGAFRYETDGFRDNNDLTQDIYNAFIQVSLSHKTSIQAEYRYADNEKGDLPLRFHPDNFFRGLRKEEERDYMRFGFHHAFTPRSDIIASLIFGTGDFGVVVPPVVDVEMEDDGYMAEVQHLFRAQRFHLTSGVGHYSGDRREVSTYTIVMPPLPPMTFSSIEESDLEHTNLYIYPQISHPGNFIWTIGASADFLKGILVERDQFNPKLGLTWALFPNTTARAAVFRTLTRTLVSSQTLEPTQVAGFNQFFDDPEGTESWRYGIGVDQKFSPLIYAGLELSRRDLKVPFLHFTTLQTREADWDELLGRAYLYWAFRPWLAFSAEYQFEGFERTPEAPGEAGILEVDTHRIPLGVSFFHPMGFRGRLKATYVDQEGEFEDTLGVIMPGDDQFWLIDASIGYRLPNRLGLITIEARNLFNEGFNFQDMDAGNPGVYPERLIFGKFTVAF